MLSLKIMYKADNKSIKRKLRINFDLFNLPSAIIPVREKAVNEIIEKWRVAADWRHQRINEKSSILTGRERERKSPARKSSYDIAIEEKNQIENGKLT